MAFAMLFYFQFVATSMASGSRQNSEEIVVHCLVHAGGVDEAAEQVTASMKSAYLKIGDIRRAFVVRTAKELGQDRRLLTLSKQAERSRYAFLFEFANGAEALCGPSLSQLMAARVLGPLVLSVPSGLRIEVNGQN